MVVGVHCPEAVRRGRLEDRGWDEATMAALEAWQWPEADKLARCAHVVENGGTLDDLHAEARRLLQRIDADRRADEEREHQRIMALWSGDNDASAGADTTAS
jgi:23S rRNA pseudouridine1911/1915/1917 synthase